MIWWQVIYMRIQFHSWSYSLLGIENENNKKSMLLRNDNYSGLNIY